MVTDPASSGETARTRVAQGELQGIASGDLLIFRSVPYAAPPVGDARFALPRPVPAWSGLRDATRPGPSAPQRVAPVPGLDIFALVGDGGTRGDDFLTLDVWTPIGARALPVMVYIHGGGFVAGNKDAPVQDGSAFARSGVVCISINYRLGIEGFLPIAGAPTNLGLRDMLAALTWVGDNVAAFGGDPGRVTVFGESAGAMAIADLVASPMAKGLFQRAIIQSGHGAMVRDIAVAGRLTDAIAAHLGVELDVAGFKTSDWESGLDAVAAVGDPSADIDLRDALGHEPVFGISRFIPVHGDDVLPQKPIDALRDGIGAEVDVLIGTNAEEMNLYFAPAGLASLVDRDLALAMLGRSHPEPEAVLAAYGLDEPGRLPGEVLNLALTDLVFRWPARLYAAAHAGRTWMYEFDWRSPAFDGRLGAAHAVEIPFVFDTLPVATGPLGIAGTAPPADLAQHMHALWVRFATDGTLPWQSFEPESRQVYRMTDRTAEREPVLPAAPFLPD